MDLEAVRVIVECRAVRVKVKAMRVIVGAVRVFRSSESICRGHLSTRTGCDRTSPGHGNACRCRDSAIKALNGGERALRGRP
jgi:hypothetical protein